MANAFATQNQGSQKFLNGEIHQWYRTVHGFADHLVNDLLDWFGVSDGQVVLDPFCGSGTTMIECMKRNVPSVGVDANPVSCFVANAKTNWGVNPEYLLLLAEQVVESYDSSLGDMKSLEADPTYVYMYNTGMLDREWVNRSPLLRTVALKRGIARLATTTKYKRALLLSLMAEFVFGASNVRFGPELYCGPKRDRVQVLRGFLSRVETMATDLDIVKELPVPRTKVVLGDSRNLDSVLSTNGCNKVDMVISSPPYPAEHDYTRNTRLELAFLEEVEDASSLRLIKKTMMRSHTKGIYSTDDDGILVKGNQQIEEICRELDLRASEKKHGFARLYSTVVREYFGGMLRHFKSLNSVLNNGAMCAYVVGDQSCYLRVHVPTAEILAELVPQAGFTLVDILHWRQRWSTTTSASVEERILVFKKE